MSRAVQFSLDTRTLSRVSEEQEEAEVDHQTTPTNTTTTTSYTTTAKSCTTTLPPRLSTQSPTPPSPTGSDSFTPPGSPGRALSRDPSVHQLYKSARLAFEGGLEPRRDPAALPFPIRTRASIMIPAQEWEMRANGSGAEAGGAAAAGAVMGDCIEEERVVPQVCICMLAL